MRDGCYEVLLIRGEGAQESVFEEATINDKTYVYAEPGLEYSVKVNVYRDAKTREFPVKYLRIGLYCDGKDVNYWKRLDMSTETTIATSHVASVSAKFLGFKKSSDEMRAFTFAVPGTPDLSKPSDANKAAEQQPLGQLRVVFYEAKKSGGMFSNNSGNCDIPLAANSFAGDLKIWQQPSITTTAGRKITSSKEVFQPLLRWVNATPEPMKELLLYYHSRQMISFLTMFADQQRLRGNPPSNSSFVGDKRKLDSCNDNNVEAVDADDADEIVILGKPSKELPILDMTENEPEWKKAII